jgi:DDE superfamily endonuclease
MPNSIIQRRVYRWMERKGVCLRRVPHQAQQTRMLQDHDRLGGLHPDPNTNAAHSSPKYSQLCETNCLFSIDSSTTLDFRRAKTVSVTKAPSTQRATCLIGVSMAGKQITPYIVFKGSAKGTGRVLREFTSPNSLYPSSMKDNVQANAWMDESKMLDWVERVWRPWAATKEGLTYMILDCCAAHLTSAVVSAIHSCQTEVDFIPAGYTSKLQVMDVGLNCPFKDEYRRQFELFMVTNATGRPRSGRRCAMDMGSLGVNYDSHYFEYLVAYIEARQ